LLLVLLQAAISVPSWVTPRADQAIVAAAETESASAIGQALIGVRVDGLPGGDSAPRLGLSGYLLPFEIVSMHLLVVLIGAAFLARAQRRTGGTATSS
jgi:NADH-quinone oxidoreductase subunit J